MTLATPTYFVDDAPASAFRLIARSCFLAAAATALASAAVLAFAAPTLIGPARVALVTSLVAYAGLTAWARRRSTRASFPLHASLYAAGVGAMLLAGAIALSLHDGVRDPALGLLGAGRLRHQRGRERSRRQRACAPGRVRAGRDRDLRDAWRGRRRRRPATRSRLMMLLQCLVVASGLAAGALIARVVSHYLRAAADRERHTQRLLRLAADLYWEQDREFRFTHIADPRGLLDAQVLQAQLGLRPWEVAEIGMSETEFDAHRADLEAHRPFAGMLVRRRDAQGRARVHSVSGEPRFTADGVFDGYWGVARDVTEEMRAQRASIASETRYRELFERSPSPLYLHRRGIIYDANPAAARLFGFSDPATMSGVRLVDLFAPGEAQERVGRRIEQLESMKVGEGLPVDELNARTADGRRISVQATGVRVDSAGGPATLSILFDITARQAAETALRRSEAMLSHLVATSPDCITLSELKSGRHTMVNAAFARLTGFAADEVVGRTATELGLWQDLRDRDRLRAAMEESGRIDEMPARLQTRSGGDRLGAGLGRALHDGRARLHGRQRARRDRGRACTARACG